MVFAIAEPEKDALLLRRNVRWIEEQQKRDLAHRGMWGYPLGNGDNSNSQFAILALYEAQRAGIAGQSADIAHGAQLLVRNRKTPTARGATSRGIRERAA